MDKLELDLTVRLPDVDNAVYNSIFNELKTLKIKKGNKLPNNTTRILISNYIYLIYEAAVLGKNRKADYDQVRRFANDPKFGLIVSKTTKNCFGLDLSNWYMDKTKVIIRSEPWNWTNRVNKNQYH